MPVPQCQSPHSLPLKRSPCSRPLKKRPLKLDEDEDSWDAVKSTSDNQEIKADSNCLQDPLVQPKRIALGQGPLFMACSPPPFNYHEFHPHSPVDIHEEPENLSMKPEDLRNISRKSATLLPVNFNSNNLRSHFQPHPHPQFQYTYYPTSSGPSTPPHISPPIHHPEPAYPHYQLAPAVPNLQKVPNSQDEYDQQNEKLAIQLHPSRVTRYACPNCSKSYSTYSGMSKHLQFHCASQNQKSFSCKFCDRVYVSLGALKMHVRTHTRPNQCTTCGKSFSRPWLLQGHMRTHTGEKPYECSHCHRAFADRSNLRAHLQTHSEVKKYSCKTCSKTFSRMSLLIKHEEGGCGLSADVCQTSY